MKRKTTPSGARRSSGLPSRTRAGRPRPPPAGQQVTATRRQMQVLRAIAAHGTARAAADALCLSPHTVEHHLQALREATGLHHLPQLVDWAHRHGLLGTGSQRRPPDEDG